MNKHEVTENELYLPEGIEAEERIVAVMGSGDFIAIHKELLGSKAFRELSVTAKAAYLYYTAKISKRTFPVYVRLKLDDFIHNGICASKQTFTNTQRELVELGLLDQVKDDHGKISFTLKLSERWRWYGTEYFCHVKYDTGNDDK